MFYVNILLHVITFTIVKLEPKFKNFILNWIEKKGCQIFIFYLGRVMCDCGEE